MALVVTDPVVESIEPPSAETTGFSCETLTASVSAVPLARLTMRRLVEISLMETVFSSVTVELAPNATDPPLSASAA
ncbi:hypothetical protein AQ914_04595 [Burkholderia pseudomallei]|nr:hypothetical protein AQ914_04595 [Burkholderia pseudomallei]